MSENHTTINISTATLLKVFFIAFLVWFLFIIRDIVLILLVSLIISSAIDPLVDFLQKHRIPRVLSVLFVYIVFLGIIVSVFFLLIPPITQEFQIISKSNFVETFHSKIGIFRDNLNQAGIGKTIENNIKDFVSNLSRTLFQTTKGVVTGFVSLITIFVISFYLTVEESGTKKFLKYLVPFKHQAYTTGLVNKIQKKMGSWVLGQLILSAVIFGLTFIGLTVLKVDFALALALIAGLLEIIPYVGPFLSAVPAVFFAFLQNPPLAIAVIILYIVVQQLENHIIVPVVMSKSVGLNPVIVILGILIGGSLGGIIGALIAVPVLSGASVFIGDILEGRAEEVTTKEKDY